MGSRSAAAAAAASCWIGGDRPNVGLVGLGRTTVWSGGPRLDAVRATGFSGGETAAVAAKLPAMPAATSVVLPTTVWHGTSTVADADVGGGVGGALLGGGGGGCGGGVRSSSPVVVAGRLWLTATAAAAAGS